MADTFKFELVSPQRLLLSAHVTEVIVPGSEGDFTVLRHHAPFVAMLRPGILRVPGMEGELSAVYVRGGIADVNPAGLTVLAEQAVPLASMDRGLIEQEIKDAEIDVAEAKDEDTHRQAADTLERLQSLQAVLGHAA
jgi:F-type H+-transporting ATPase subunit epsilon